MHILCTSLECHIQLHVAVYLRRCDHHELLTPSGAGQLVITELILFSHCLFVITAALHSRCGHYIFALWFLLLSSSFSSLPNLSSRRLDVYFVGLYLCN